MRTFILPVSTMRAVRKCRPHSLIGLLILNWRVRFRRAHTLPSMSILWLWMR